MKDEALLGWLANREPQPPPPLLEHVRAAVSTAEVTSRSSVFETLAEAAMATVDRVSASPDQGRRVAPQLLAADALITYALESHAMEDPDGLAVWADAIARRAGAMR